MVDTQDIVKKLWSLCDVLRDDGITYHQYVTELTYLLFLKMMEETERDKGNLPSEYNWSELKDRKGTEQFNYYKELLLKLGTEGSQTIQRIYNDATTSIREPKNLQTLITAIDQLDWFSAKREGLGDLYEGLLEKNATEKKSGAGQYFTPRPLIDCMVDLVQPEFGESIQDPAAGTGGFLISADQYIGGEDGKNYYKFKAEKVEEHKRDNYQGMELVPDAHRLGLMNLILHDLPGINFVQGDTMTEAGASMPTAKVMLTNPPFGTKKTRLTRTDFTYPTSNKQLNFLQHVYRKLEPEGRAGIVLPDNVLFAGNDGAKIRADMMNKCNLHTILRLPTGIFYSPGVKTNVLFFSKPKGKDTGNTKEVWIYDMRANMPSFGKRTGLTRKHFDEFVAAYGPDKYGKSKRKDQGEEGRFRMFTRDEIAARGENLDISWLRDENEHNGEYPEPEEIAAEIMAKLDLAMSEIQKLTEILESEEVSE